MEFVHDGLARDGDVDAQDVADDAEAKEEAHNPPTCTGGPQTGPLPGAYRKSALPALQRRLAAERLSLRDALAELDTRTVELDEALLANVNTPDDLRRLA